MQIRSEDFRPLIAYLSEGKLHENSTPEEFFYYVICRLKDMDKALKKAESDKDQLENKVSDLEDEIQDLRIVKKNKWGLG